MENSIIFRDQTRECVCGWTNVCTLGEHKQWMNKLKKKTKNPLTG